MDINSLNSAERETLMIEVLNTLRVCIPNINRPASVLINQNKPMSIEEKGAFYHVTAYLRAVDYAGKYLFLGPFYLTASKENDNWVISEPRFDCGIDGCYYDVVGVNNSHLKIYEHMVTIDDEPIYFEDCDGVSVRDNDDADGVVRFDLKDGRFKTFHWNKTTQNPVFMTKVQKICDLMISNTKKMADNKAAEAASREAQLSNMRPAMSAAPAEKGTIKSPFASAPASRAERTAPAAPEAPAPAAPASSPFAPAARSPFGTPLTRSSAFSGNTLKEPVKEAPQAPAMEKPAMNKPAMSKPEMPAPAVSGSDRPQTERPFARERQISLKTNPGAPTHRMAIHNPEVEFNKATRELTPDDIELAPKNSPIAKSPFVPLKNPTPDMIMPEPEPGPAIAHGYVGEWGKGQPPHEDPNAEKEIRPMTAQTLAHLDDWKPARSVVTSPEEELAKYKKLLEIGAITEDEFEIRKMQLTGY